ncbi:hypothetical protein BDV38DRAFT_271092 [Aspergillus pseudotamarii]|uniref:Enoyl reductase (ER) domain-containing protein n=1 Tax=Aspergillus pseudotamarii TaxID=132259 RepID=A0A5N6SVI5_ASPPS|nr:uncharacterized protein BDV38DRAFT_271092 [Aspergillus pseudotamarii]KAE8137791.1 hypothetical protein BDV38DRAFT_271092 [Aspergillus pseudotamarii]
MQAIRIHPTPPRTTPYSPSYPGLTTALQLDNIPVPKPSQPGELLARQSYNHSDVFSPDSKLKPGDQTFGMADIDRAATWAEYTIPKEDEIALKPTGFTFAQAAAVFHHARIPRPTMEEVKSRAARKQEQRVLITEAAGAVGVYLVQLAAAAGITVIAVTSSNARNGEFLQRLQADKVVEYSTLRYYRGTFDAIIDVLGGEQLDKCWDYITETGVLNSIDSASFNFVEEHEKRGLRKSGVRSLLSIVKGSVEALHYLTELVAIGALKSLVADTFPLARAQRRTVLQMDGILGGVSSFPWPDSYGSSP